jgi:hypothetical protein
MKTRMWTAWSAAAAIAGVGLAADKPTKPAINYNLTQSSLPSPAMLTKAKPVENKSESMPELPVIDAKATKSLTPTIAPVLAPKEEKATTPSPTKAAPMKSETAVQPAVMKPAAPTAASGLLPVAGVLPSVDDHMKCLECLKTLSGSPVEAERKAALEDLSKGVAWTRMKSSYMILRRIALTEYNTKMRADAVKLLGEARMEHALAADTLKLSAQYDSDQAIRTMALATLERLASLPPDRVK